MDKKTILSAIELLRKESPKRGFNQSVDMILNFKGLNLKDPTHKVEVFLPLPHPKTRKVEVCAIVDDSIVLEAKKACVIVIPLDRLQEEAKKKREMKKLARRVEYFITQPHLMKEVAGALGKILGVKGKMPNPKSGCIIPPKAPLAPIVERLRKTVRLITKNDAIIKCSVGDESMKDDTLADNINAVYTAVLNALPQKENNLKSVLLKLTMSAPVKLGERQ